MGNKAKTVLALPVLSWSHPARLVRFAVLALAMLSITSLAACTSSLNPVGPLAEAVEVPDLLGTWAAEECSGEAKLEPGDHAYLQVFPVKTADTKQLEIVLVTTRFGQPEQGGWFVADGYVTALRNGRFINLRLVVQGPKSLRREDAEQLQKFPYSIAIYKFAPGQKLVVGQVNVDGALAEGTKAGRLTNICGGSHVCVTDSSANIANYLGSLDETVLFKDQCVFQKIE